MSEGGLTLKMGRPVFFVSLHLSMCAGKMMPIFDQSVVEKAVIFAAVVHKVFLPKIVKYFWN